MLKINKDRLVEIAVEGRVAPALAWPNEVGHDGRVHNLPGPGSITYNVLVGDLAFGWMGDHVEPGVSTIFNPDKRRDRPNAAYNFLACAGNEVIVMRGAARGKRGRVIGHHGGVEHVICDFPKPVLQKLALDDKFQIRSYGQGLELADYPGVAVKNCDPAFFARMGCRSKGSDVEVPVAAIIAGKLAGSGVGSAHAHSGDCDIQTADEKTLKKYGIDKLKFGDLVAIQDHDASFGWCYRSGAVSIGIIIHGNSHLSGHGPGVMTIMTSADGRIQPRIVENANIGRYLKLGRYRK